MKYFSLVWSALFRSKTRTLLTLLSVTAAFLLFGLLDSVRVAFNSGGSVAGADRLVVASRLSITQMLPYSLQQQLVQISPVNGGIAGTIAPHHFRPHGQTPQFLPADALTLSSAAALGLLQVAIELPLYLLLAAAVGSASRWFSRTVVRRRLEYLSGTVLVALGVRVALTDA